MRHRANIQIEKPFSIGLRHL